MIIRKYDSKDLNAILHTWEVATKVGHPFLANKFIDAEKKNIPTVYIPNGDVWVATIKNDVVGFTILHGNEVGALFVEPKNHGGGIGYALMNKARELHSDLIVEVFEENTLGREFYSRYGFILERKYLHEESRMMMLCLKYTNSA